MNTTSRLYNYFRGIADFKVNEILFVGLIHSETGID